MHHSTAPHNFSWIIQNEVAGMGRPQPGPKDFEYLKDEGVEAIVSLTEHSLDPMIVEEFGFEYKHIPVVDFTAPAPRQIEEFVDFMLRMKSRRRPVAVHCAAGRGRTGTMLSCYLVALGRTAEEAMREVRKLRPYSIETIEQEYAIAQFARRQEARRRDEARRRKG